MRNLANSLVSLGTVACLEDDHERAHELLEESLGYARELGNVPLVAAALSSLALVSLFQDDLDGASTLAREAMKLAQDIGDRWTIGECLHVFACLAAAHGDVARAAHLTAAAEALHESLHSPPSRVERIVRERISAALDERQAQAALLLERERALVLVMGEAGAGKTTLMR
jgi:tetratricopeptide (TPR) repeat protein